MQKSEIVQQPKPNANTEIQKQQLSSPKIPTKEKLSAAEIQRRKINAASEYFRKLREEANKNNTASDNNTMSPKKPETPPVQQPSPRTPPVPVTATVVTVAGAPAQMLGPPPPLIPNDNSPRIQSLPVMINKPNIDLGEVVRSTIINGVTKQFSQVTLFCIYKNNFVKLF